MTSSGTRIKCQSLQENNNAFTIFTQGCLNVTKEYVKTHAFVIGTSGVVVSCLVVSITKPIEIHTNSNCRWNVNFLLTAKLLAFLLLFLNEFSIMFVSYYTDASVMRYMVKILIIVENNNKYVWQYANIKILKLIRSCAETISTFLHICSNQTYIK